MASRDKENSGNMKKAGKKTLNQRVIKMLSPKSKNTRRALEAVSRNASLLAPHVQRQIHIHASAVERLISKDQSRHMRIRAALMRRASEKEEVNLQEQNKHDVKTVVDTKLGDSGNCNTKKAAVTPSLAKLAKPTVTKPKTLEHDIIPRAAHHIDEDANPIEDHDCFIGRPQFPLALVPCL